MFQGTIPSGPLSSDKVTNPNGERSFSYHISDPNPIKTSGGTVRIIDSTKFPAASTIAVGIVEVAPVGLREMHWHPNTDEWQYYLEMNWSDDSIYTMLGHLILAGDVGAVPFAYGHYMENTSADVKLRFLEVFKSPQFQDVSLNQWMALTPPELIKQHMNLSDKAMNSLRKDKSSVVK